MTCDKCGKFVNDNEVHGLIHCSQYLNSRLQDVEAHMEELPNINDRHSMQKFIDRVIQEIDFDDIASEASQKIDLDDLKHDVLRDLDVSDAVSDAVSSFVEDLRGEFHNHVGTRDFIRELDLDYLKERLELPHDDVLSELSAAKAEVEAALNEHKERADGLQLRIIELEALVRALTKMVTGEVRVEP